ncbi:hypothetical protein Tco_0677641 [Tanacetum coccineum]|uniref:Uncharacterized protein n=1 Tax=Tanacetum coccineum TaxID=301880 RepID=A0ABQ4XCR9_9ASTR
MKSSKKLFTMLSKLHFVNASETYHTTLYEALEVSMQHDNNDELHATLAKSRKRLRDDQDPPLPPPKDLNRSKKKKHDSDSSASKQPPIHKSLAWKTSDSREAPFISSKKSLLPYLNILLTTIKYQKICIS